AVGLWMKGNHLLKKDRLGARDVSDGLAGHRLRQEADEITGMTCLERHADFAVGLEAADAWAVSGTRVYNDEGPPRRIDLNTLRRNDPNEGIVDGPIECAAVRNEVNPIVKNMRGSLGQVLAILVATLTHDVPEQDAALRRVGHVLSDWSKQAKRIE